MGGVALFPEQVPLATTVRVDESDVARVVGHVAFDRLAGGQTGRDEGAELNLIGRWEFEGVEGADEDLAGFDPFVQHAHDGRIRRAAAVVDEEDLVAVDSVQGHQIAYKDFVGAVAVDDLEAEVESVAHLGRLHVDAIFGGDAHDDVGSLHHGLLAQDGDDVAGDLEVHLVGHALVSQVVLAMDGQAEIGAGDDAVVVLEDDVIGVAARSVFAHVALDVVVGHAQFKVEAGRHVVDARIGAALGVDFAVEDLARSDLGHHVSRPAVDGHVVARAQLVRCRSGDLQVGLL